MGPEDPPPAEVARWMRQWRGEPPLDQVISLS